MDNRTTKGIDKMGKNATSTTEIVNDTTRLLAEIRAQISVMRERIGTPGDRVNYVASGQLVTDTTKLMDRISTLDAGLTVGEDLPRDWMLIHD